VKNLLSHRFDARACRSEWNNFEAVLTSKTILSERDDVLPLFKRSANLSLLICSYFPHIRTPDLYAHEYSIDGDFVADLVVGDSSMHNYLLVEFENGATNSIFH
jgi:hypothetical protein